MTGADVSSLISAINSKDSSSAFGENWIWIIGLLIVAGIFGGNGFFGGNSTGVTEEYIANQFNSRDLYNNNTNILNSANSINTEVLNNRYNCSQNYSNLRYDTAVGNANLEKDILLGNSTIQAQMSQNALQAQANLDSCCCTLRSEMRDQIQSVKDLINANTIQDLRDAKQGYELVSAIGNGVNTVSNRFGNWYMNNPINPYYAYNGYYNGTTIM